MKTLALGLTTFMFIACEIKPQPINYGSDGCAYCKMTIVDKQYASQMINNHGKNYNFDAVECMMNYSKENSEQNIKLYQVSDFNHPGEFLNAMEATYLKSPKIASPMAENLSAYKTIKAAEEAQREYDGQLFSWKELQDYFKVKN